MLVVGAVGLACKAFLRSPLCNVRVDGLPILERALRDTRNRRAGRGVVTVSNHISTLDDPLTWGILPLHFYFSSFTTRWALGASDIIFTNPLFSAFFTRGQTLETFRGKGIYQPAVDTAIRKLDHGNWVHLYGEGKINQPKTYPRDSHGNAILPRFKWGVGRIIMEAQVPPVVIPMWITGFDQLMPEGRPFPYNYLPRIGAQLTVTFGEPVPPEEIEEALRVTEQDSQLDPTANLHQAEKLEGWLADQAAPPTRKVQDDAVYTSLIRQKVTAIIHSSVFALGRSVSGKLLDGNASGP